METLHDDRRHNFTIIDNEVLTDYSLTAYELAVYVVLASHTRNGTAFPGLNRIASLAGCSKPTAIKAIKGLENKGLVSVVRENEQDGSSNQYRILPVKKREGCKPGLQGGVNVVDSNHTIEDISSKDDMGNSVPSLPNEQTTDIQPSAQNEKDKEAPPPDAAPPPPRRKRTVSPEYRAIFAVICRRSFNCEPAAIGTSRTRVGRIAKTIDKEGVTADQLTAGFDHFKRLHPDATNPSDAAKILDWVERAKKNGHLKQKETTDNGSTISFG